MSGRITIDGLSDSLKEYLNTLGLNESQVQQLIDKFEDEKIGDLSTLTTENKTVVAAINELFQSANNGKELIATAIGEPLNSSDTFSAMSGEINNLNSQFKSALMNNGVSVESTDKFKQLIEKLALLADSEGKGIQYASGYVTYDTSIRTTYALGDYRCYKLNISGIGFKPDMCCIRACSGATTTNIDYNTAYCDNYYFGMYSYGSEGILYGSSTSDFYSYEDGIYMPISTYSNSRYEYFIVGVGEEDTTLRDSLASILEEKGVVVASEDDLASLIAKVDTIPLAQGNAVEANVLSGKTFTNADGIIRTGTMANRGGAQTVTPSTSNKTLNSGYYSGNITVKGDSNLVAANIVSGKSIFGVKGTAPKGYKFISGTGGTLYSGDVYSGSPSASSVLDIKGYTFWFNGIVKVTSYITDNGSTANGESIGKYTIELYDSSGTLKSTDTYIGYKATKTVKDYTVSNGDYFRYKPDNRANYGSGIFKMNVLIQTSVTTV